jgi:CO/xanthine dehydrogenase FAD-binding subunit
MEANRYLRPATLEEAHQLLLQDAKNILLGGGLWLKKSTSSANALIDLSALGLDQIKDTVTTSKSGQWSACGILK